MSVDKSSTLFYSQIIINEDDGYAYSADKDRWLIEERGIGFKDIIRAINDDKVLRVIDHPNHNRYPNQKIYAIEINDYVWSVPFVVKDKDTLFLKTIFRDRKVTKKYLSKELVYAKEIKKANE